MWINGRRKAFPFFFLAAWRRNATWNFALARCGRVRILDCYSDPLGWKKRIPPLKTAQNLRVKANVAAFSDARDANKLMTSILDLGQGTSYSGLMQLPAMFLELSYIDIAISIDRVCWARQVSICSRHWSGMLLFLFQWRMIDWSQC